jgi:hypothetical protein
LVKIIPLLNFISLKIVPPFGDLLADLTTGRLFGRAERGA